MSGLSRRDLQKYFNRLKCSAGPKSDFKVFLLRVFSWVFFDREKATLFKLEGQFGPRNKIYIFCILYNGYIYQNIVEF